MNERRPFGGAIFDMDGLLLDTERPIFTAAVRSAETLALGDLSDTFRAMIGLRADRAMPMLDAALAGRVSLERLAERGVPCAVATSTHRDAARALLERADLARFFRTLTGGDDVVEPKPAPEIYLVAAASLGIAATDACAFEDSGPGTRAAVASGATVVQVPDLVEPDAAIRALGHVIAPDVLDGARRVGLVD